MPIAFRFAYRSPVLRSNHPLSDDQIRTVAPSIFVSAPQTPFFLVSLRCDQILGVEIPGKEGFEVFIRRDHCRCR